MTQSRKATRNSGPMTQTYLSTLRYAKLFFFAGELIFRLQIRPGWIPKEASRPRRVGVRRDGPKVVYPQPAWHQAEAVAHVGSQEPPENPERPAEPGTPDKVPVQGQEAKCGERAPREGLPERAAAPKQRQTKAGLRPSDQDEKRA